jgi:hypothetical protein
MLDTIYDTVRVGVKVIPLFSRSTRTNTLLLLQSVLDLFNLPMDTGSTHDTKENSLALSFAMMMPMPF